MASGIKGTWMQGANMNYGNDLRITYDLLFYNAEFSHTAGKTG
jgi:hypothetical protein